MTDEMVTTTECSVAVHAMQTRGLALRESVSGQPRGPLCGMGVCFECRLTIDGVAQQRSCQTPYVDAVKEPKSTKVRVAKEFDVLVVGAGPAGLAAACVAAEAGRRVGVVDDNPRAGGQIWRHDPAKPTTSKASAWLKRLSQLPIEFLAGSQVIGAAPSRLHTESADALFDLQYRRLILACGARERFLPFPGWTLPGVYGAGGLQALVKSGYSIRGKRVVVAGSGPLLLAVAAYLRKHGATVLRIAEQTPRGKLMRFSGSLLMRQPGKIIEALGLGWQLRGIPLNAGCWPVCAEGSSQLEAVTLTDGVKSWREPCDALACGFGLVPNLELPTLLGCAVDDGTVRVNVLQQTSIEGIYAVGELTGVGGLDKALLEGRIAGLAAVSRHFETIRLQKQQARARRFVRLLDDTFALREELRHLADESTIVCRCEDVTFAALRRYAGWRDAKLQTRCGMGPCQGRICGPALQHLFGWSNDSIRPPVFPTALGNLAAAIR